ncbi:hypothetical protein [Vibrio parahaemolyticus]|uniref:hypothetical protein n=1 Tax=Vibrio parahaemolyticus TaxID=670 RepID=UPI0030F138E7
MIITARLDLELFEVFNTVFEGNFLNNELPFDPEIKQGFHSGIIAPCVIFDYFIKRDKKIIINLK